MTDSVLLADFGTSYCKLCKAGEDRPPEIIASRDIDRSLRVHMATGHNSRRFCDVYVNELTALARGGERLIGERDFILLDCGSRDIKYVRFEDGRLADMGWNAECGASMGFTIELLAAYYHLDYNSLAVPRRCFPVTCGVLGLSKIFDAVIGGDREEEAVARFVKGIAINAYRFAGSPARLYLSGGLCDNPLFTGSFPCELVPLGRFVLLTGLQRTLELQGR